MLVYLPNGEPFAQVRAAFGAVTPTYWRYVNETVELLARRARLHDARYTAATVLLLENAGSAGYGGHITHCPPFLPLHRPPPWAATLLSKYASYSKPHGLEFVIVPSYDDHLSPLHELVERQVMPLIDWYQRRKRWPRRLHKATTAVVIILGALIPIASAWSASIPARVFVGAVGVTITTVTSLAVSFDWHQKWRLFTVAQGKLESQLATWEFSMARARMLSPEEGRAEAIAATSRLLEASNQARNEETEAFFESHGAEVLPVTAKFDGSAG